MMAGHSATPPSPTDPTEPGQLSTRRVGATFRLARRGGLQPLLRLTRMVPMRRIASPSPALLLGAISHAEHRAVGKAFCWIPRTEKDLGILVRLGSDLRLGPLLAHRTHKGGKQVPETANQFKSRMQLHHMVAPPVPTG
jgi:hypothetical protein